MNSRFHILEGGKKPSIFADLEALQIPRDDEDLGEIPQPPPRTAKRRQFRRYDETWAVQILAADPPLSREAHRLVLVLLAEADFQQRIKVSAAISTDASLTRQQKRGALEQLEQLGLIAVEWRGQGRVPIVTPLRLGGRPGRR